MNKVNTFPGKHLDFQPGGASMSWNCEQQIMSIMLAKTFLLFLWPVPLWTGMPSGPEHILGDPKASVVTGASDFCCAQAIAVHEQLSLQVQPNAGHPWILKWPGAQVGSLDCIVFPTPEKIRLRARHQTFFGKYVWGPSHVRWIYLWPECWQDPHEG